MKNKKNKTERKDKRAKTCNFLFSEKKKNSQKSNKTRSADVAKYVFLKEGHRQRKHKKEKQNTCGIEPRKTRREKRDSR